MEIKFNKNINKIKKRGGGSIIKYMQNHFKLASKKTYPCMRHRFKSCFVILNWFTGLGRPVQKQSMLTTKHSNWTCIHRKKNLLGEHKFSKLCVLNKKIFKLKLVTVLFRQKMEAVNVAVR